jgi:hypothetical protein
MDDHEFFVPAIALATVLWLVAIAVPLSDKIAREFRLSYGENAEVGETGSSTTESVLSASTLLRLILWGSTGLYGLFLFGLGIGALVSADNWRRRVARRRRSLFYAKMREKRELARAARASPGARPH